MNRRVLLVGWDAADWKVIHPLLDRGEMPNLARLIEGGVMGDITTLEPVLSPMLWNSIATGKYADQHGILGFTEVDPVHKIVRPVTSTSRRTKAIWNILTQQGYRTHVIHWFGGHPAEPINGICVSDFYTHGYQDPTSDWPMIPGTVHPPELAATLADLRLRNDEIDDQMLTLFVPRAVEVDQHKDRRLAALAKIQTETINVHTAATYAMETQPWDFMGIYYPSIDHFSHGFMNFHPPRMDWVPEDLFELYKDVVNSGYRFHDLMLGRLLQLAGPDTTVILCSDHGFHSDHLRPREIPNVPAGPAEQHRPLGIFVMHGPGVKQDEIVYGASLLDVAPTILNLFGLPAGLDMPGRTLLEAMENPAPLERIPGWDQVEGEAGMHRGEAAAAMEHADAEALIEQFVALGYIERPDADKGKAVQRCERERMWNLARVYLHSGRPHLALPVLEGIWDESPDRSDYGLTLASCQAQLGMGTESHATAMEAVSGYPDSPGQHGVLANIAAAAGRLDDALAHFQAASRMAPDAIGFVLGQGSVCLRLRRWDEAAGHFARAIEIDAHDADAYQALAQANLRRQRWEDAAAAALQAVAFEHHRPWAHLYLGIALLKLTRLDRALQAIQTALSFHPPLRVAHFWMARALWGIAGRQQEALEHRALARVAREVRLDHRERLRQLQAKSAEDAAGRSARRAERRQRIAEQKTAEEDARKLREAKQKAYETLFAERGPLEMVLVSGLPRSGTSLMMQMLQCGGMTVMTDGERAADVDNPRGYLEWEAIKRLPQDPSIIYEADGKVVKVISMLLAHLPEGHRYKVIFMDRPVDEVAASHDKMIRHRGQQAPETDPTRMKRNLARHRESLLQKMKTTEGFEVLVVDYPALVQHPAAWVARITAFVGPERLPNPEAMSAAVDPTLHRNRIESRRVV